MDREEKVIRGWREACFKCKITIRGIGKDNKDNDEDEDDLRVRISGACVQDVNRAEQRVKKLLMYALDNKTQKLSQLREVAQVST